MAASARTDNQREQTPPAPACKFGICRTTEQFTPLRGPAVRVGVAARAWRCRSLAILSRPFRLLQVVEIGKRLPRHAFLIPGSGTRLAPSKANSINREARNGCEDSEIWARRRIGERRNAGSCARIQPGECRRQGDISHQLVRPGGARRLLSGESERALRKGRARRHAEDGRPAGQRRATSARRRDRLHDGLRPPGPQNAGARASGHHGGDLVPVRSARNDDPRQRGKPCRSQGQDDPGRDLRPHHVVALAQGEIQIHRRTDQALYVQPAALLRRQERGAAVLSVIGAVPGQTAGRAGKILPVRARRLSALWHDHGHDARLRREESGRHRAFREGVARRLEELPERSGAGECAHQGRQSQDERGADRLRHRTAQGAQSAGGRRRADDGNRDHLAFGIEQLKALKALEGGDAQTMGIGIITQARWKATYDFMVSAGLLKPEVDWKQGFTDRFVKTLKLSM